MSSRLPPPFPQHESEVGGLFDPKQIWRALEQTHRMGSEYATVPFPSFEQMCLHPYMGYFMREGICVCLQEDEHWDDENVILCLKDYPHDGQCGKPGTRYLGPVRVE